MKNPMRDLGTVRCKEYPKSNLALFINPLQ